MGRSFRVYLAGEAVFLCRKCGNHLAVHENVESKVGSGAGCGVLGGPGAGPGR